jgi:hypothetical protein
MKQDTDDRIGFGLWATTRLRIDVVPHTGLRLKERFMLPSAASQLIR